MFKCNRCNKFSKPSEQENKVVTQTRQKEYYEFYYDSDGIRCQGKQVGTGQETVREIKVCNNCAATLNKEVYANL